MTKFSSWLGLSGESSQDTLPLWHGVSERTKWGSFLICFIVAVAVFALFTWLLSPSSGFAAYIPALCGFGSLLVSTLITERIHVRSSPSNNGGNR